METAMKMVTKMPINAMLPDKLPQNIPKLYDGGMNDFCFFSIKLEVCIDRTIFKVSVLNKSRFSSDNRPSLNMRICRRGATAFSLPHSGGTKGPGGLDSRAGCPCGFSEVTPCAPRGFYNRLRFVSFDFDRNIFCNFQGSFEPFIWLSFS